MSNKTSDKNVEIVKELIQEYKTYGDLDGIQDLRPYIEVLEHILAELEQKDKRIKELEKALLKVKDKNTTLFITCRNSIPEQAIKDKIEKLKNDYDQKYDLYMGYKVESREQQDILKQMSILQELLEGG